jgi:amino acid transporter
LLPALDEQQLAVLRDVGREWDQVCADPEAWRRALPVDPGLGRYPDADEFRPTRFSRFVPVAGRGSDLPPIETTRASETPATMTGRAVQQARRVLLGAPLDVSAIAVERMRKLVALPVLSADALSSVAYGPEAMLAVLVLAGSAGLAYSLPIGAAIAFLMLAVGVSYRQTIRAYPHGGGSYIVASDNLGRVPGLMAAAGLLVDYVMTVAVSIAAGVAAITSAVPALAPDTTAIGLAVIAVLLVGNLRGVRQAGAIFAAPTYAFIVAIAALVIAGLVHAAGRGFHPVPTPHVSVTEAAGVLLVLRAFASGSTAMTGIEAVSNAVPAFRHVEWRNARATLTAMITLLIAMFAGVLVIARLDGVVPRTGQTVTSQLAHASFGSGAAYVLVQAATAAVLLLAANTSYNDFPRVMFLMAMDSQAPRSFLRIGDRLTFRNGIIALSLIAAAIYVAFRGDTESLIPLYAVGVFLAFTMSQAGMVVHWSRHRDQGHWRRSLVFNGAGALLSAVVFVTAGVAKFASGAWVAVLLIALIVAVALGIRRHYQLAARQLALHPASIEMPTSPLVPAGPRPAPRAADAALRTNGADTETEEQPERIRNLTLVPVAGLDLASMRALAYAASMLQPVLALHISPTQDEAIRFGGYWQTWGDHLPLEVVVSPHRALTAPLVHYIWSLHRQRSDLTLTVILPETIVRHWWHRPLHNHTASRLRRALRPLSKIVVTTVPFHLNR